MTQNTPPSIEWLLTRRFTPASLEAQHQPYGDLTALNATRVILDAVGRETLASIAADYLDLLESSSAIYERNGDYALGIFTSGWCQFLDTASRDLSDTTDNAEALASGRWHCHESCWNDASKRAIETDEPVDIPCSGGIRLYALPIDAGGEVIGSINFGYGDPPRDADTLRTIAERYDVDVKELEERAAVYHSRPSFIVELAKDRLSSSARLIGTLVERARAETALQQAHEEVQVLNEELQSANEELQVANEDLDKRVRERTEQLEATNEELQSTNEELRVANEELQTEMEHRTLADREARASAIYVRNLIEASLDPLVTIDAQGTITDVNKATEDATGCSRAELIGSDFSDYFTESAKADAGYKQVFTDGFVRDYPLALRHRSGKVTDVLYNATLFRDERGEVQGVFAAARDITERKRAEEQLRATSLYARNLIEASLDPLVTISIEGKITDVNKATEEVTGYLRHELIGSDFSDYFTVPAEARKGYERAFADGFVKDYPLRIRHKSGILTDVLYNATVYRNEAGEIQGVFAAARDVTERKRAEAQLRAASLYARSLIEASLDPLVTISIEGKITDVNKATEEVTGYLRHELIGSDFSDYFTVPDDAKAGYQQVFADGFVKDYPLALRHKSGKITDVLYNATVYRNEAGNVQGVFAAARDVTDRKRAEEELQRYSGHLEAIVQERTTKLKDAERLAGIGQTAAMIGHDLRNPLQGLQYIVDLQKLRFERIPPEERGVDDWAKVTKSFDRISEQIFYMDKIVGDLQDYARPVEPHIETISLSNLIDDVLQQVPHDDVHVTTALADVHVEADQHLMRRVFTNIILNALQAMPSGGTLTVSATADDGAIAIHVTDAGVGIPQDMKDKLFSPLTTGKAKGTGLGLAVVKRIVEAHNGTITFESEEGKGTTFTVTLPQATQ